MNMSTSIEYLDNIENNTNNSDNISSNVKVDKKGFNFKSIFNETNMMLVVLVSILLYPGTLQFVSNLAYTRNIAKSNFFFIIHAIIIVLLQTIMVKVYGEN